MERKKPVEKLRPQSLMKTKTKHTENDRKRKTLKQIERRGNTLNGIIRESRTIDGLYV